jgi:hypothetical protein
MAKYSTAPTDPNLYYQTNQMYGATTGGLEGQYPNYNYQNLDYSAAYMGQVGQDPSKSSSKVIKFFFSIYFT